MWGKRFKAGSATLNPKFPFSEWDRLIPRANITLNILRAVIVNPKHLVHVYCFSQYDYNRISMTPPGTRILAYS